MTLEKVSAWHQQQHLLSELSAENHITNSNQTMLENRQDVSIVFSWGIRKVLKILVLLILILILYGVNSSLDDLVENQFNLPEVSDNIHKAELIEENFLTIIKVAVVACQGSRKDAIMETLTMIKSAVTFSKPNNYTLLHFLVFTDDEPGFQRFIRTWPETFKSKFKITFHEVNYPLSEEELKTYKNWWAPCASFRLFLPEVLKDEDAVIYVDTDVIFLTDISELWNKFTDFNEHQVAALAPRKQSGYSVPISNPNFIDIPENHVKTQVNSGVFLMNLTRMRSPIFNTDYTLSSENLTWSKELLFPLYQKFNKDMAGDQNLVNVIFHYNAKLIYFLDCKFNYHHKFCIDRNPTSWCKNAEVDGASIIHGSARAFYNNYAPAFKAVFIAFQIENYFNNTDKLPAIILNNLREEEVERHPHCGNKVHVFTNAIVNKD